MIQALVLNTLEQVRAALLAEPDPANRLEVGALLLSPEFCAAWHKLSTQRADLVPIERIEALASEVARLGGYDFEEMLTQHAHALAEADKKASTAFRRQLENQYRERIARLRRRRI